MLSRLVRRDNGPGPILSENPGLQAALIQFAVGGFFADILTAICCTIAVLYLWKRKDDRKPFRYVVAWVALLEVGHLVCGVTDFINVMAANYGNVDYYFVYSGWAAAVFVFNGLTFASVQGFYAWRCWILWNKNPILLAVFALLIASVLGTWVYFGAIVLITVDIKPWSILLCFIMPVVTDLLIVVLMLGALNRVRSDLQPELKGRLQRIAILTISTNALTTIMCIIVMGGTIPSVLPETTAWGGVGVILPLIPHAYFATLLTWIFTQRPGVMTNAQNTRVSASAPTISDASNVSWKPAGTTMESTAYARSDVKSGANGGAYDYDVKNDV